jgi:DNA-binding NarL/FixJ family response regulator
MRLIGKGRHPSEIARELTVSERIVRRHASNLLRRPQLEKRIQEAVAATLSE